MIDLVHNVFRGVGIFLRAFLPMFFRKLPIALVTLWFVATLVFVLLKLAGGEESTIGMEGRVDERTLAAIKAQYYLDQPILVQYYHHIKRVAVFDSLPSRVQRNRSLRDVLHDHLPVSFSVAWRAITLALAFGVPIGVICATRHNGVVDKGGTLVSLMGVSVPSFILASLAVYFLGRVWQVFPATGWHLSPIRLWVPAACLAAFPFAAVLRLTRASMLEALRADYIRTARAKGVAEWKVILRHALRNSLSAVVTYVGPVSAGVLVGSLVVEKIFDIPGLGDFFVKSINNRDLPLVMGMTVFYSSALIFMNLVVDSLYPVLNPRLRD